MQRAPLLIALLAATAALGGCGDDSGTGPTHCADGARCRTDGGASDARTMDANTERPTDPVALSIDPMDPVVNIVDGARPPPITFTATVRQRDGNTRPLTTGVRFALDNPAIGTVDPMTGVFTAAGLGGTGHVRADTLDGSMLSATTSIRVNVSFVELGMGVTPADRAMLDGMTPMMDPATIPTIDYPLEGAVMPRNVFQPSLMWTPHHPGAAATDLYRVRIARPDATFTGYYRASMGFQNAVTPNAAAWSAVAQSDLNDPIQMTVAVLAGGVVRQSAPRAFRTVDGVIAGAVYYWSPSAARLRRIDVDTAHLVDFMPNPGSGCIGCHSVSRDGRRLAGALESPGEDLATYNLTVDLSGATAPTIFRMNTSERRCTSWNQSNTRIVSGDCGANPTTRTFSVLNSADGSAIGSGAMAGEGFDPEWGPDRPAMMGGPIAEIAYTDRNDNLTITPVMPGDTFGAHRTLHMASSTPGGPVDWHPTFTPDGNWLVYQHGTNRRTAVDESGITAHGALWSINHDGTGNVRLDRLNGGPMQADSYRPVMSPFNSGGYFWVLFTSTRDYGNAQAGTRGLKQIWVAAINNRPDGTSDPSNVPYYLSGQERVTALSPYWAPPPCRSNGASCSAGGDCCSGNCGEPDMPGGDHVCRPPGSMCRMRGQTCETSADCCAGNVCSAARICDSPPPG